MDINPLQVLLFLLGFGSILFLAYITTKYLAGKSNKAMRGKYMQVVETLSLGLDKRLMLVRAGGQYVLLAATSKRIEFLTTIDIEETGALPEDESSKGTFDFREIFDKYINVNMNRKGSVKKQENEGTSSDSDDFGKFKANLGKLRTILQKGGQVGDNDDETTNEK